MADLWLNGEFVAEDAARIDPRDAGLLHAAGVFTTMRAAGGRAFRLDHHLRRLRRSCEALFVPLTHDDGTLERAVTGLLERNGLSDARMRLTVTRGRSDLDPLHGEVHRPTAMLSAAPLPEPHPNVRERGLTVVLNSEQKLNPYDVQAGHKTLDYMSRFAALREAARRGAGESLWFNVHNYLQSGCVANVFAVEGDVLVTPPTNDDLAEAEVKAACPYPRANVLPGVVRGWVMDRARVRREPIDVARLLRSSEVFLTNSIFGVVPVTRLEQHPVADAAPGPVTRKLMFDFDAALKEDS